MSVFSGGSAYATVRDIADGYIIITELTFKQYKPPDFQNFLFEADKLLREIRATQPAVTDTDGIQKRQRRIQRVQQALTIANNVKARRR
jgi:hypothetical protein